jgi:hypothetical protein
MKFYEPIAGQDAVARRKIPAIKKCGGVASSSKFRAVATTVFLTVRN